MKPKLQLELKKKYPILQCSIGCDDGWYKLIDRALSRIVSEKIPCKILQVKEKFGGVRIYTSTNHAEDNDKIDTIVQDAEAESANTCEVCGKDGITRADIPWIRTLCTSDYNIVRKKQNKALGIVLDEPTKKKK